jgi:hypothetical protein
LEFGAFDLGVLDLAVLPDFFEMSGGLAMSGIWDESGGEKRAIRRRHPHHRVDADMTLSVGGSFSLAAAKPV